MRRWVLLGLMVPLGGCSGLGNFFHDTARLPGQNPNATTGSSENLQRVRGQDEASDPILPEAGNVWPGPPQPLPTLSDVSRSGGAFGGSLNGGGAAMPPGGSMSMGEQQSIRNGAPLGDDAGFGGSGGGGGGGGGALMTGLPDPAKAFRQKTPAPAGDGGNIVIPNGDGTSTIISPDGTVRTVKGVPR